MTPFEAEKRYNEIIRELEELIPDRDMHREQQKFHEKIANEKTAKIKALAKEREVVINFKLPHEFFH
jgi:hypothetical protein